MRAGYAAAVAGGLIGLMVARQALASEPAKTRGQGAAVESKSILGVLGMDTVTDALTPRGIRNNNPLNIRENQRSDYDWRGEMVKDIDVDFEEFVDARYGYRAGAKILDSYARRGINTLRGIIATWAPSKENNVEAYIASVARRSGLSASQRISRANYVALFEAMTQHENGQQPYSPEFIAEGVSWAYA